MTPKEFIQEVFRINRIGRPSAQIDALDSLCEGALLALDVPFSDRNRKRCEAKNGFNHSLESWSISDWFLAVLGELGEAANVAKKLNRIRDGIPGNAQYETEDYLKEKLAEEIADTLIYLDLLAQRCGLDLEIIRNDKFLKTSKKIGYQE